MVHEVRLLYIMFDEGLTWVPHLRSLRLSCQIPLDLLHHLSHTTWGPDRTTLLLYLVLVCSKLDYGANAYCTGSPHALLSSPIASLLV